MATFVNKNAEIYIDGFYVQGWSRSAELKMDNEPQDCTTLADTTRIYLTGLNKLELNIEGYDDYAATGLDAKINMVNGATGTNSIITLCPQNDGAGSPSYTGTFNINEYVKTETVGEMVKFTINAKASGSIWFKGTVLEGDRSVSGAGSGTAIQLGAVTAAQGVYAALHVTLAGTNLVVKLQSDSASNFPSATDVITFATTSAVGAELKSVAGANTDTYWRCSWTLAGGNSTFTVVVGIR